MIDPVILSPQLFMSVQTFVPLCPVRSFLYLYSPFFHPFSSYNFTHSPFSHFSPSLIFSFTLPSPNHLFTCTFTLLAMLICFKRKQNITILEYKKEDDNNKRDTNFFFLLMWSACFHLPGILPSVIPTPFLLPPPTPCSFVCLSLLYC